MKSCKILLKRLEKPSSGLLSPTLQSVRTASGWWRINRGSTNSKDTQIAYIHIYFYYSLVMAVEAMCLGGSRYLLMRTNKLFMIFRSVRHTGYIRCRNQQLDTHKHAAQQPLSFRRPQPPSDIIASSRLPSFLPTKRGFVAGNTPKILGALLLLFQWKSTAAELNAAPYLSFF